MDNEAFRALVEERAKPKSTKEIAREAVEEEFRTRKQKRKRGGAGGSSSED
jgi:ribosome assembly protein YihI (activator of Der GTPase)